MNSIIVKNAENAYCKLYIYSPLFTKNTILELNQKGIEAKHLGQDYEKYYGNSYRRRKSVAYGAYGEGFRENAAVQILILITVKKNNLLS